MTRYLYLLYLVAGFCCLLACATGCNFEATQTLQAATPARGSELEYEGGVADSQTLQELFSPPTVSQNRITFTEQSADLNPLRISTGNLDLVTARVGQEKVADENSGLQLVVGQLPTGEVFYRFTSASSDASVDKTFDGMVYVNGHWRNFPLAAH